MFKTAFLAASILPVGSEPLFIYYLGDQKVNWMVLLFVASLGNSLGSLSTYYFGKIFPFETALKKLSIKKKHFDKVSNFLQKRSSVYAFLCFVPVFGDVFAFYYGTQRWPVFRFLIFMGLGKIFRYYLLVRMFF